MMKRMVCGALAVAVVCCLNTMALAGPGCCKDKSAAKGTTVAAKDGCCKSKDGAQVTMASMKEGCCSKSGMPTMAMKVGDKSYNCPMEAGKAAEASKSKIVYVVAGESYECKDKAEAALVAASEEFISKFTTIACVKDGEISYCNDKQMASCSKTKTAAAPCSKKGEGEPAVQTTKVNMAAVSGNTEPGTCNKTKGSADMKDRPGTFVATGESSCSKDKGAKFMVAGRMFDTMEEAQKAREVVLAAIKPVSMKYVVDGKEVDCSSKVCPKAKADGKVTFVVKNEKMTCESSARMALVKAQYEAAMAAAEKVTKS